MGHKFLNDASAAVTEMLEGFVQTHPGVKFLDGFPDVKVVVRSHVDKNKVALVSGGGSGHEPAHAGFVGDGMLDAAVCGDVFASPSVAAVLAAIRHVTGHPGCLLFF
jgi:dihydroxyacetone kinase